MHAEKLCHKWLSNVLSGIHKKRLFSLSTLVTGAIDGGCLSVTGLGRALRGKALVKHNIKKADRLLSNKHLDSERMEIYTRLAYQVVGSNKQPVILVDWSDIDARRKFFLLRAGIAIKGRSLTLYEEVHDFSTKEKQKTHSQFLRNLKKVLPQDCIPIIVTDAGFRGPWFKQVLALGWDYIGRVRNREKVKLTEKAEWEGAKTLYAKATGRAKLFANVLLTKSNPNPCSLILFKAKLKGRKRLGKMGKKARSRTSLVNSARAREPWLLATSLPTEPGFAKRIVRLYSTRMQIEESFRDTKCPRFGLSLYHNRTYKIQRMRALVLIGSIAATFAWILGKITRTLKLHMQYQANTIKTFQVLSNVFLGVQVLQHRRFKINWTEFQNIIEHPGFFYDITTNRT